MNSTPILAIVGRPNVGKSTFFNKLIGKRVSIVDDTSGVTRDRIYGISEWRNRKISLIDTGGIELNSKDTIVSKIFEQAKFAIDCADVILFVVDVKSGITPDDIEVAALLKKSSKPTILCVNKCDSIGQPDLNFYEFYNLGFSDVIQVSSIHGHGTGDVLDTAFDKLNFDNFNLENTDDNYINVALIGKPNVGKSSLINHILGKERSMVSDIAGTTRDNIDEKISNKYGEYNFIDTAGIRRKSKIRDKIEKYSIIRSKMAIEKSDVCVILIDALEGVTEQDTKIAGIAHNSGKGIIIAVNKWDAISKNNKTMFEFKKIIQKSFSFMSYSPIIFISAKTGQNIDKLFELINLVNASNCMRISTGKINDILAEAIIRVPPPTDKGKSLKIYYMTQVDVKPPKFVFFVNKANLFHFSYQRYIENSIRNVFGLVGTSIEFIIREKARKNL